VKTHVLEGTPPFFFFFHVFYLAFRLLFVNSWYGTGMLDVLEERDEDVRPVRSSGRLMATLTVLFAERLV
jgi:hypothetical protein